MKSVFKNQGRRFFQNHYCETIPIWIVLFFALPCFGVEDLTIDIPYPLTPPSDLFPNIDRLQYIPGSANSHAPSFLLSGEVNVEREYNVLFDGVYSLKGFKHHFGANRSTFSEIFTPSRYRMFSSFYLSTDSVSLEYDETGWYSFVKSVYGINAHFSKNGRGYTTEFSGNFHRSDSLNDYFVVSKYHRFYGYVNMLSIESSYRKTPYLLNRKRSIVVTLLDRFVYSDFFFVTPGIKAEFLSQTHFTPLLSIAYLVTKHLSFSLFAKGQELSDDVQQPYQLPFLVRNDSLEAPLNIFSTIFESTVMIDSLSRASIRAAAKKTRNPLFCYDNNRYYLRQTNLDTAIIFYDAAVDLFLSRNHFDVSMVLRSSFTPFYDNTIPYQPDYRYDISLYLKPLKQLILGSELSGSAKMFSDQRDEIEPHRILSLSLEIIPSPYFAINIKCINATNFRGPFINDVHYPGIMFSSGATIQL
jgi:hypothetical protein